MGKKQTSSKLNFADLAEVWSDYSAGCYWFPLLKCFKKNWETIESMLLPSPRGKILDGGCGTGGMFKAVLKQIKPSKIVAVDWSEKMLNKAKKVGTKLDSPSKQIFEFRKVDLTKPFPWKDNTFDAALFNLVLNYLPSEGRSHAVHEAFRTIKPGGYFYTSVQLEGWDLPEMIKKEIPRELIHNPIACLLSSRVKKSARKIQEYADKGIIKFPTKKEFINLPKSSGFKDIKQKGIFWDTGMMIRARKASS